MIRTALLAIMDRLIALRGSPVVQAAASSAHDELSAGLAVATSTAAAEPSLSSSAADEGTAVPATAAADAAGRLAGRAHVAEAGRSDAHAMGDRAGQEGIADAATLLRSDNEDSRPHSQVLWQSCAFVFIVEQVCSRVLPLPVEGRQNGLSPPESLWLLNIALISLLWASCRRPRSPAPGLL